MISTRKKSIFLSFCSDLLTGKRRAAFAFCSRSKWKEFKLK